MMARPGLRSHPKFKRLLAILRIPEAHLYGHLQMLWDAAYEFGEEIGDDVDVEINAGWAGDPGALCKALSECAGTGRAGFIESIPEKPGHWRIHDLYDHAPTYVQKRMEREAERIKRGQSIADIRRAAAKKMHEHKLAMQTDANENHLQTDADESMQTDANGRTPLPGTSTPLPPKMGGGKEPKVGRRKRTPRSQVQEISLVIPEPIVNLANSILGATPAKQGDGSPIRKDPGKLATRLMTILDAKTAGITPDVLFLAWQIYLKSGPKGIKAPQYFFGEAGNQGSNGAHWLEWARFAYRKLNPQPIVASEVPLIQEIEV